jgi:Type IV conjugative transfer system lipoprotein (TraV)
MSVFRYFIILVIGISTLCGCAAKFACDINEGLGCKSLSEVYEIDERGSFTVENTQRTSSTLPDTPASLLSPVKPVKAEEGTPIYRVPRRLRVWIADWRTSTAYVPNHYIYTRIDEGEWLLSGQEKTGEQ